MCELANTTNCGFELRWHLLATASIAVLAITASGASIAGASDNGERPTVWIELGGQLERVGGGQERFSPAFTSLFDPEVFSQPTAIQRRPRYMIGSEAKASFSPSGSDWIFSAAIRYGRSNRASSLHQETSPASGALFYSIPLFGYYKSLKVPAYAKRYVDGTAREDESHTTVDFQVGKDVGLGLFGSGSSLLNVGVRFAQFESHSKVTIGGDPDFAFTYKYATSFFGIPGYFKVPQQHWHLFASTADVTRSFSGLGPSVAWDTSTPIFGDVEEGQLTVDLGINGAVLFGRQKTKAVHQTTGRYQSDTIGHPTDEPAITSQPPPHRTSRSRSVVVPNVGGFAGLSFKFPNAKVSLGYRADVFFGAIDGGIDARKTYDRDFYGPFATISVGL